MKIKSLLVLIPLIGSLLLMCVVVLSLIWRGDFSLKPIVIAFLAIVIPCSVIYNVLRFRQQIPFVYRSLKHLNINKQQTPPFPENETPGRATEE
jgi:hypothetical protein